MKKAILVRFDDKGELKIVVSGKKYIPGVNLCKCCYVKVRNKSEKYSDVFNLALDLKHEENLKYENTEKSLPEADLEFLYGPDCDYDIWVLKELVSRKFYSKEGKKPFTLTGKDVKTITEIAEKKAKKAKNKKTKKVLTPDEMSIEIDKCETVEELMELISTTEIDRTNRGMNLSDFLKSGDDFFEKIMSIKTDKDPKPKTGNEDVDKMVMEIFGLKNPMDILTLENKDIDKAFFKMMSSEDGVKKVLELANLVKTKLESEEFVNKDDVWSKAMKKRTDDLIETLSKKSDDIKKETKIEDPKDVMLKQLCKTLGVDYDKYKEFENIMYNILGLSGKVTDIKNPVKDEEIKDKKSPSFDLSPFTEMLCKMFGTDPEKYKEFKIKLDDKTPGLGEHKHVGIGEEELSKVELKPFTGRPRGGARCVMSQQQPFMGFGEIKTEDMTSILKPFEETTSKDLTSINKVNIVLDITDAYEKISTITSIPNYKTFPKDIFKFDMKINKTARKLIAFCQSIVSPYFASYAKYYFTGEFLEFMKSGQLKDLNIPLEELNKLKFKKVEREDEKPLENSKPDIKPSKGISFQDVLINITKDGKLEVIKEFDKKDVYQILHTNRIHTLVKFFRYLESTTNCINVKMYFTEDTVKHFNQTEEFKNIEFGKVIS